MEMEILQNYWKFFNFGHSKEHMRTFFKNATPENAKSLGLEDIVADISSKLDDFFYIIPEGVIARESSDKAMNSIQFKKYGPILLMLKEPDKACIDRQLGPQFFRQQAFEKYFKEKFNPILGTGYLNDMNELVVFFLSQELRGLMNAAMYSEFNLTRKITHTENCRFGIELFSAEGVRGQLKEGKNIDKIKESHFVSLSQLMGRRQNRTQYKDWIKFQYQINSFSPDEVIMRDLFTSVRRSTKYRVNLPDFHVLCACYLRSHFAEKRDLSGIHTNAEFRSLYPLSITPWMLYTKEAIQFYLKLANNVLVEYKTKNGEKEYRKVNENIRDLSVVFSKFMHMSQQFRSIYIMDESLSNINQAFNCFSEYWKKEVEKMQSNKQIAGDTKPAQRPGQPTHIDPALL